MDPSVERSSRTQLEARVRIDVWPEPGDECALPSRNEVVEVGLVDVARGARLNPSDTRPWVQGGDIAADREPYRAVWAPLRGQGSSNLDT